MHRLASLVFSLCLSLVAFICPIARSSQPQLPASLLPSSGQAQIIINVPEFKLRFYIKGKLAYEAPVGVGKVVSPTELGDYRIVNKAKSPTWYPPDRTKSPVPPGPKNPLGPRWMGLDRNGYGIHGTIVPSSIGHAVSLGCIRMKNEDVQTLFDMVPVGTPVKLAYERIFTSEPGDPDNVWIKVLPDVYKRTSGPAANMPKADIESRLAGLGLGQALNQVDTDLLWKLIETSFGANVYLPYKVDLAVNDKVVKGKALKYNGELLIPIESVATPLGLTVGFDGTAKKPTIGGAVAAGAKILAGRAYLTPEGLEQVLGVAAEYSPAANQIKIKTYTVKVNGLTVPEKGYAGGNGLLVPLRSVCEALKVQFRRSPSDGSIHLLGAQEIAATNYRVLGGRTYIDARLFGNLPGVLVGVDDIDMEINIDSGFSTPSPEPLQQTVPSSPGA